MRRGRGSAADPGGDIGAHLSERFERRLLAFRNAVLNSPGSTEPRIRALIASGMMEEAGHARVNHDPLPETLRPFVDRIAHRPYLIGVDDFAALRREGYSEDAILEVVAAAALGAALARLNRALHAMGWETLGVASD